MRAASSAGSRHAGPRRAALLRSLCAVGGVGLCVAVAGCSSQKMVVASKTDPALGVAASPRVIDDGKPVPKGGGVFQVGKPYKVAGRLYTPNDPGNYSAVGLASWYGEAFHGRRTANGEIYDKAALSAAHPTLPLPSYVRVTNVANNRSVIVRVNDRGPFHRGRLIDVSKKTADLLGFRMAGVGRVQVDYVGLASIAGSDDRKLLATYTENGQPAQLNGVQSQLASLFQPPATPSPPPPRSVAVAAAEIAPPPPSPMASQTVPSAPVARPALPRPPATVAAHTPAEPARMPAPAVSPTPSFAGAPAGYAAAPVAEPAVVVASAPTAASGARARVMLSWGGIVAPMPLAAASDPTLPPTATALSSY